jgi:hypothetical protein
MTHLGDAQVRQLMLDRLGKLSADSPARWGKMSAHQMICHLSDAYRAALGEKRVTMRTGLAQRTVVKWIALYGPLPWLKGLPTLPEMKQGVGGTPPTSFNADREMLIEMVDRFASSSGRPAWHPHPIFAEMSDADWLRWGYLHADHHLRQFGL